MHIRLAYSHDDDYNVTKNSERKEKHWDFDHWRIVSACPDIAKWHVKVKML